MVSKKESILRISITLLLFIISNNSICQSIEGIWIQDYVREINIAEESSSSTEKEFESLLKQLDTLLTKIDAPKIDTFYQTAILPYFFNSNGQLNIYRDSGKYAMHNDSIFITINKETFRGVIDGEEFTLFYTNKTSGHFFKHHYDSIETLNGVFESSWWKIYEGQKELFSVKFDSTHNGTIKRFDYSATSVLFKGFTNFYGVPLLAITDMDILDSHVFILTNYSDDHFEAIYYYPNPYDTIPERMKVHGRRIDYNENDLDKISNQLIGSWYTNDISNVGAYMTDYDTLVNTFCKLQLRNDQTYEMHYGGNLMSESGGHFSDNRMTGMWKLGKTGEYIEVSYFLKDVFTDDPYEVSRYFTIHNLNSESLHLSADLYALDIEDVAVRNIYLELTRQ